MTDIISENVLKNSISPQYTPDKTPEQSFHERALFVFNIFYESTESELRDLFLRYGPAKVKLMMNENSNKNKGHAFVEYTDAAHAKEAVKQLNGYMLRETKIKVQFNTKQPPWYANNHNSYQRRQHENIPSNSIYVRNLDNSISSEDLESHFGKFSPVKVSLVMDHMTKRNKGYAFVDFPTVDDATTAIKHTNGMVFFGRQLHVEYSNRGSNLDSRKSESVSSLVSDLDDQEMSRSRIEREKLEEELAERKRQLEDAKSRGSEQEMQSVREHMYRLQDEIAHLKLAEQYPESKNSRSRSREEKRKKKRRSDEADSYYSDETTPGMERSYTPTSFSSRRSTHRGSISSNSSQGDDNYLEHRVFVGGVNHATTPETFRAVFSKFGKISSYFLKWDKLTGRNKGFGFVSFDTSEQMENLLIAHKDNPVIIDGHTVNIKRVFPESYVSPFPLNIPPMLCRAAPHFSDPPPYVDDKNPLPEDPKIVEFFYNLGIVHYNLLRINVYHWNLLFPGNMFSTPKLDSTPPTRQPSPAPSFPTGPNLPNFTNMDPMHRAQVPLVGGGGGGGGGGGVRGMFPHHQHHHHHNNFTRPHMPSMHHPPDLQLPLRFNNKVLPPPPHHTPTSNSARPPPHAPIIRHSSGRSTPAAAVSGAGSTAASLLMMQMIYQNATSDIPMSRSQYSNNGSNNSNSNIKRSNSYNNNNNNSNHHPHNSFPNFLHQNSLPNNHTSYTHTRSPLDSVPVRMQHLVRHVDQRKMPDKVSPSSFSPTAPFSPDTFSPSKIMVNHSSPPDPGEAQNNSSYGSHEDTLTYEPPGLDQGDFPPPPPGPSQPAGLSQHSSFNNVPPLHQGHTGMLHEMALSPPSQPPPQQPRQPERSRSSSGSYNETDKLGCLGEKSKQGVPNSMASQLSHMHISQHPMSRNQAPGGGGGGGHQRIPEKKEMLSKESMDLLYLRNLQHLPPTTTYPPGLPEGLEKARMDNRSPHCLPPPGYNPMQVMQNLHFPPSIQSFLYPRPGLISSLPPPHAMRGFPASPTPSEEDSEEECRQ